MSGGIRVRKLPLAEARRLFPDHDLPRVETAAPRECLPSRSGRHEPLDLSGLRYRPTPPFCAWCGAALEADGRAWRTTSRTTTEDMRQAYSGMVARAAR